MALLITSDAQAGRGDLPPDLQPGYESPKAVADRLRSKGVEVIAVGCCGSSEAELREIAGGERFALLAASSDELKGKVTEVANLVASGEKSECKK